MEGDFFGCGGGGGGGGGAGDGFEGPGGFVGEDWVGEIALVFDFSWASFSMLRLDRKTMEKEEFFLSRPIGNDDWRARG